MWHEILSKFRENSVYFRSNEQIALVLGIIVLAFILYALRDKRKRKLPPGPIGLPIFGYYFFLGEKHEETIRKLSKKYGNVIGLYLGPQYIVFLNDWDAMKDAYNQSATVNRPPTLFDSVPFKFGVVGANGEEWVQTRRVSSKAMKDIGLHNTSWEQLVEEEVTELVKLIKQQGDRAVELRRFFRDSFTNNIVTLTIGKRLPTGHSFTMFVAECVDAILENTPTLAMMNFSPTLNNLLQVLGIEKKFTLFDKIQEFSTFISKTVDDITLNPDSEKEDSFITRFHEQIEIHKKSKEKTYITENAVKGTVLAMLAGGSETSRCTIIWALIGMAENQDKQRKVQEEIDRVIGKDGAIRWPDRFKLPYTNAAIMESMRWETVVPFTTTRIATEDIEIQGYHIPKGTYITTNSYSLHNDLRYWKNPEKFIPERFLLEEGRKVNTAPESFNPFSYGKRICPGKLMAQMEILQYFCILLQNFKVMPKEGNKVKHGSLLGLTFQATGVELRFIPR